MRWPEAFPVADITAEMAATMFVNGWISCFGVPSTITTDQGGRLEAPANETSGCQANSFDGLHMYHPSANGLVERFHCQLKAALRAQSDVTNCADHLPLVLFGIRTVLKEHLHCTAAELVHVCIWHYLTSASRIFDSSISNDLDPVNYVSELKATMQQLQATPPRRHSRRKAYVSKDLAHCTHVFVRHDATQTRLQPPYVGPYKVIERGDKTLALHHYGQ